MSLRCVIYSRKSNLQEHGLTGKSESVERQLEHGRAFAEAWGWTVVSTFTDDAVSGATYAKLKGRRAMMEAAEAGSFQALVISEQSRLGRHMIEVANAGMEITDAYARGAGRGPALTCSDRVTKVLVAPQRARLVKFAHRGLPRLQEIYKND